MTREELIAELNNRIGFETDYEAYSMSDSEREFYTDILKILEQEPCEDCISRQYLIDIATKDGAYDYISAQEIANAPSVKPQEPKTDILDKIRAEIEQLPITDTAIRLVTEIIDKYKKTESEENKG